MKFIAEYYHLDTNRMSQAEIVASDLETATCMAESYLTDEMELVNMETVEADSVSCLA